VSKNAMGNLYKFRESILSSSLTDSSQHETSINELQEAYRQRLARQIAEITHDLAMLRDTEHTEEALLNLMHTLSSMASTADTFGHTRLGELSFMMLSLVKEWVSKNGLPNEQKINLLLGQLKELALEVRIELEGPDAQTTQDYESTPFDQGLVASRENLRCYEYMVSTSSDMLAMVDPEYRYVIANRAYAKQFDMDVDEIVGKRIEDVVGGNIFKQMIKPRLDKAMLGFSVHFESWITIPKQKPVYIDILYVPYQDDAKKIRGIIVAARDITTRKTTEDLLAESEFRFRQLANNIPQVFFLKDSQNNNVLYVSPAYERIWKQECESLYQNPLSFMDAVHPDDRKIVMDGLAQQKLGKPVDLEYRILRSDGEERYIRSQSFPAYDKEGELSMTAGIAEDITQRHLTNLDLQESEQKFHTIFDMAGVGVAMSKLPNGDFIAVNKRFSDMLGYGSKEILSLTSNDITHPRDLALSVEHIARLVSGEIESFTIEKRYMNSTTGQVIWARSTVSITWSARDGTRHMIEVIEDITDSKLAQNALVESEERFRSLTELSPCGIFRTNRSGDCIYANTRTAGITGMSTDDCLGTGLFQTISTEDRKWVENSWKDSIEHQTCFNEKFRLQHDNGKSVWAKCQTEQVFDSDGKHAGFIGTMTDITELKLADYRGRQAASVFENTIEGIMITDSNAVITAVNPAFEQITGYAEQEVVGKNPNILHSGRQLADFYQEMWTKLQNTGSWQGEIWNRKKDGEVYPGWLAISTIKDENDNIINYVGVFSDISDIKQAQGDLAFISYHDPLTDLPNRRLFYEHLSHAISRAARTVSNMALMFIDLDRFKHVNDSLGHNIGDELLALVAQRLAEIMRGNDTISRIGGDEFTILIEDMASSHEASTIAEKLINGFSLPFITNGHELFISPSIGISIYPEDGTEPDILLKNADAAMYRAKEQGRNSYKFYAPAMSDSAHEKVSMETSIHHAMNNDEFRLYYQPQYDLRSGKLVGAEALLRWNSQAHGEIPPARFIPIIEESSTILRLGDMIMDMACKQSRSWTDKGYSLDRLAINISGRQIQQNDFVQKVAAILEKNGIQGDMLDFEITEGFIMRQARTEIESLNQLRSMGISLSIDDFGTGYSSLSYLKLLPVDTLKIDQSFVRDIGQDSNDEAIARAIIALGHSLGLKVIAEGVETECQNTFLRDEGCDQIQGFLRSRPLPAAEFEKLLKQEQGSG
jgi:diguanylate cyclase (GGDEF)-like protein/PAS domain S-box-containing protein